MRGFLEATWNVFIAAFCSPSSFAHPRLEPKLELAGGNLDPRASLPLVALSLFLSVYFLVGRNKITNHSMVFFQGK